MAKPDNSITMESVQIIFRNFAGKEGKYNKEGDRNFGVILPEALALQMIEDGWNVKQLSVREEDLTENPDAVGNYWLPVTAEFRKGRPPRIFLITDRGRTALNEETVEQVDWVDIQNVDMIVNPSVWEVNGNTGTKAYLRSMYITIEEDELERKYAELDNQ